MSELVRVARDGKAVIVKTDDGDYVRSAVDGTGARDTAARISVLTAGGGWRRVTSEDLETFAEAAILATGRVFVEESTPKPRVYRVPPTVQSSIRAALEAYGPLLSDADREVARRLAENTQVSREDISWMHSFYEATEKALALHGGRRGQNWAKKVLAEEAITADASPIDPAFAEEDVLFIAGSDEEDAEKYDTLYMVDPTDGAVYVWQIGEFVPLEMKDGEIERDQLIELDAETAQMFAERLNTLIEGEDGIDLADLNPEERNLFDLAESEIDFEYLSLLADATGYSPVERSVNAQRQPRQGGGKFGEGSPAPIGKTTEAFAKAHISDEMAAQLVEDILALLEDYVAGHQSAQSEDAGDPVLAAAKVPCKAESCGFFAAPGSEMCRKHGARIGLTAAADEPEIPAYEPGPAKPTTAPALYLAIVDRVDKTAVLDVVSVVSGSDGSATGYRREGGKWIADEYVIQDLKSDTPPPLVELTDEATIKDVLSQVDESDSAAPEPAPTEADAMRASAAATELADFDAEERDKLAKKGYALPDGSFPIKNEADLKNAISAYGRAKDKAAARKHIQKRARALNRADLIPDSWKELALEDPVVTAEFFGPYGEVLVAAGIPGVADTPEDFRNVERLKRYWTVGPGGAKIRWGTRGDLTRAHRYLMKYLKSSEKAWGMAQNLHKRLFGVSNATKDKAAGH